MRTLIAALAIASSLLPMAHAKGGDAAEPVCLVQRFGIPPRAERAGTRTS